MPEFYKRIHGWSSFIPFYAKMVDEARDGARFVEVGVWMGRSAVFMGEKIRESGKQIHFSAVDTFEGGRDVAYAMHRLTRPLLDTFKSNLEGAGLTDFVNIIQAASVDAAHLFSDGELDLAFIDAQHSYEAVKEDMEAWWRKVRCGGILAGHDYAVWPGVTRAVHEFAETRGVAFRIAAPETWAIIRV